MKEKLLNLAVIAFIIACFTTPLGSAVFYLWAFGVFFTGSAGIVLMLLGGKPPPNCPAGKRRF